MARSFKIVVALAMFQMITKISIAGSAILISPRGLLDIKHDSTNSLPNIKDSSTLWSSSSSLPNSVSTTAYFNASEPLSNSTHTRSSTTTLISSPLSMPTSTPEVQLSESTTLRLSSTVNSLAISSTPSISSDLTPTTSPISAPINLKSTSITPYTSSEYNLTISQTSNPTQTPSSSTTPLKSTISDPTLTISSPLNVLSSTTISHTSEPLNSLSTTSSPVISTSLYLSKPTFNIDRPTVPTDLYLWGSFPIPVSYPESSSVPLLNSIPSPELTPIQESVSHLMDEENLSIALLELLSKLSAISDSQ